MNAIEQKKAARQFAGKWQGKGYEKGDTQKFWLELLQSVLGIDNPYDFIEFEDRVMVESTNFMDGFIPATKVLIEQKSVEKELGKGIRQSDGSTLNPFQQAKRYIVGLPVSRHPRWVVTCNFREFRVHDMEHPHDEPYVVLLKDLEKEYNRLQFLVDEGNEHLKREQEVSVKAGELVGMIYDKLLEQYWSAGGPPADDMHASRVRSDILRSLNILCVRLVFCLYAEDAGLFPSRTSFHDYLAPYRPQDIRRALIDLFEVLDTPLSGRDPYLSPDLAAFPYVNGGLFGNSLGARSSSPASILIPNFTDDLKTLLLEKASADFDWSEISPTIFGAVFESTLNPETRRSGGMHYTSIENIHKVIDPLFLDDLRKEFDVIMQASRLRSDKRQRLLAFQEKLASLTFFDPACGSGNFLTETYLSLRRLENKVIQAMFDGANILTFDTLIKVNISQFYGIEINDFACTVAKTALWIAENQMMQQTSAIAGRPMDFLPLKTNAYIHEGNALRMEWEELFRSASVPLAENDATETVTLPAYHSPDYRIGSTPFGGYRLQSKEQKEEMLAIYTDENGKPYKTAGKIDYVAAWYMKVAQLMCAARSASVPLAETATGTVTLPNIKAALVSTNSITQGEQVAAIWRPLMERYGVQIDFAWRTFRWDSEADIKAHVHCVIVGFSIGAQAARLLNDNAREPRALRQIFLSDSQVIQARHINPYLMDAPNVWIESRNKPLCDVPEMLNGGKPVEGGFLILTQDERDELLHKEPQAAPLLRPYMMGKDFIDRKPRWCLWLVNASPRLLRECPLVLKRIQAVREYRLQSPKEATRRCAETPVLFAEVRECPSDYVAIPKVSSENRRYIPMEYLPKDIIAGDKLFMIPQATLCHFGILTSNVHMAWMRAVCGRLEMRYSYSNTIVYNNFPWPVGAHAARVQDNDAFEPNALPADAFPDDAFPDEQASRLRSRIEFTAQAILDARALYPDCSFADLYDEVAMPPELRRAHQDNDRAVMEAYGFDWRTMTESDCVAELFKLYQAMTK
ncbi:MAG: methylase [Paludibacteraceae bacterium]|nr:methylase [Paludibacteraceae bacterium]